MDISTRANNILRQHSKDSCEIPYPEKNKFERDAHFIALILSESLT